MALTNESWQFQGRQGHGWFGHGTGPSGATAPPDGSDAGLGSLNDRAAAVSQAAFMALPRSSRNQAATLQALGYAGRLQKLLAQWSGAPRLSDDAFARQFFGRSAADRAVGALQTATRTIAAAKDQSDLRSASEQVATAMEAVGLGNWGHFLADAQERADDPATLAAVAASDPSPVASPAKTDGSPTSPNRNSAPGMQAYQLVAAGDLKCDGLGSSGGCQNGGSYGTTGAYTAGGSNLCMDCITKYLGLVGLPHRRIQRIINEYLRKG